MKRTPILFILLVLSGTITAQTLTVSGSVVTSDNLSAKITNSGVVVSEANGLALVKGMYKAPAGDPSLKAYTFLDGSFIVRENIANFLIYDSFGRVQNSISNSMQSDGGEAISELASDQFGKTIVIYNPKVITGGTTGSRAKVINSTKTPLDIYYSQNRALSVVEVSANGEFVAFTSERAGTEDEVQLHDRFGNILNTITFDQPVKGVSFSGNGLFVTIYSGSRAAAYEVRSGERVGSTSFRNTSVLFAGYDPIDKIIIGLTGSGSSTISEVQLHAISVNVRKIAREDFEGNLVVQGQVAMERISSGRYKITGLNKELSLRASF